MTVDAYIDTFFPSHEGLRDLCTSLRVASAERKAAAAGQLAGSSSDSSQPSDDLPYPEVFRLFSSQSISYLH